MYWLPSGARPWRRLARQPGFTLIELLVVILIIGVLVAVAAPSFLGQTQKAHDSAARQYLTIAYHEAAAISTDHDGDYTDSSFDVSQLAAAIQASEPELTVVAGDCPTDATTDQRYIVVDQTDTHGGDLTLCNDPDHTVWTLKVVDHQLQPLEATVVDGSGAPLVVAPTNQSVPVISGTAQVGQTLTATTGSWANSPTGYSYQWQVSANGSSWSPASGAGALTSAYTVAAGDLGDFLRVSVQATNSAGSATAASQATNAALPLAPANQVAPALDDATSGSTSHVQVDDQLSVSAGSWSDCASCAYAYTWQRADDASFTQNLTTVGTDSATYTVLSADEGGFLRVSVQASNTGGASSAFSNATDAVLPASPVNLTQPQIADADNDLSHTQVGDHLSTTSGDWSHSPTGYSYTWQRADDLSFSTNLTSVGADAASYTVQASDQGKYLRVSVQATNSGGAGSALSANASGAVLPPTPVNQSSPSFSGTVRAGSTLTADPGVWTDSPSGYTYTWRTSTNQTSWTDVGTDSQTYVVQTADVGRYLEVCVQATNAGGSSGSTCSNPSGSVASPALPTNTAAPTLSGTAQEGQVLQTSDGGWSSTDTLTYSYQWYRCSDTTSTPPANCSTLSGATAASYTAQSADVGSYLRAKVTATDSYSQSASAYSDASTQIIIAAPTNSSLPTISGTAQEYQTLSSSTGGWTHSPTVYHYQWQRGAGASWTSVGSDQATYVVQNADIGAQIRVQVTAQNAGGSSSPATSAATATVVAQAAPVNSAVPTVSGSASIGNTLTATSGTWSGTNNSYNYAWQRCLSRTAWIGTQSQPNVWWRFNGSGLTDVSGHGNNLQSYGGITSGQSGATLDTCPSSPDPGGGAWYYPGNTYSTAPENSSTEPTGSFSVEAWYYISAWGSGGNPVVISSDNFYGSYQGYVLWMCAGCIEWSVGNGSGQRYDLYDGGIALNSWYNVVGTYNASTHLQQLYVNGVLIGQQTGPSQVSYSSGVASQVSVGGIANNSSYGLTGVIDEIAIYPRVLGAGEIAAHWSAANANWQTVYSGSPNTVTVDSSFRGGPVRAQVTASNSGGSANANSAATASVP